MVEDLYTLYFVNENVYGDKVIFPVITFDTLGMDEFTARFNDYRHLYNSLPNKVKTFLRENLNAVERPTDKFLSDKFFVKKSGKDFYKAKSKSIIFARDADILYVSSSEIEKILSSLVFTVSELNTSKVNLSSEKNPDLVLRRSFFKNLYSEFVDGSKNGKVAWMIDEKNEMDDIGNFSRIDSIMVSIDNLAVIARNTTKNTERRRKLAFMLKDYLKESDSFSNKQLIPFLSKEQIDERKYKRKKDYNYYQYKLLEAFSKSKEKYELEHELACSPINLVTVGVSFEYPDYNSHDDEPFELQELYNALELETDYDKISKIRNKINRIEYAEILEAKIENVTDEEKDDLIDEIYIYTDSDLEQYIPSKKNT